MGVIQRYASIADNFKARIHFFPITGILSEVIEQVLDSVL
jgi:hypothetical protein